MTHERLHELWMAGVSVAAIAAEACLSEGTMQRRLARLRRQEGVARWPTRQGAVPKGNGRKQRVRAHRAVTLPPLPSLEAGG